MPDLLERLQDALADRYAVESEIGRGGMATVFLAEDLKHHRKVAIKVLHPDLAAAVGSERFLREIEAVASLTHPHVLPLFDSGEADGLLYYVMPYVEGESLRQRLNRDRQLPINEAIRITREVAEALDHAHRHGLIHRDIKPGNILLEGGHAVVTDFGVVRAISEAGSEKVTATGMALGTPAYMSPEQASGEEVDERSDLYSLGCVLYEMLAGEPPLTGSSSQSTAAKRLTDRPTPLPALRDTVSSELGQVVEKVLSRTPADRYATAVAFSEAVALEAALAGAVRPLEPFRHRPLLVGASILATAAIILFVASQLRPADETAGRPLTAIAVLPFENLSAEAPNAYFAGGLHDELLTQLAKVASLTVISRTSVRAYANTTKPMSQIADELGVGSIVEGSVQVVGDRLRVNVQLIDAATDAHLWAESYDRTLDDAFGIQSDVAQRVATAVGGTLARSDHESLAAAPTDNPEAYRLYLQAREYHHRPAESQEQLSSAQQLYERALALDPDFALAHAALSEVHGIVYWQRYDPLPSRLDAQLEEAETALGLVPDLPEGHLALGFWHYVRQDWSTALAEYTIAARGMPNDSRLITYIGYAHRRMGDWDETFRQFDRAIRLEPRNANLYYDLAGNTLWFVRRYSEAIEAYDRALVLAPDLYDVAVTKGFAYVSLTGRVDTLRAVLSRIPPGEPDWYRGVVRLLMMERDADSLIHVLRARGPGVMDMYSTFIPTSLTAAVAHRLKGDTAQARAAFDSALVVLDSAVAVLPDDWRVHSSRGYALAGLGRRDEALREAQWLRESNVYSQDPLRGASAASDRAAILADVGEHEAALDEIERLLSGPAWLSVAQLRLSPIWDPLRDNRHFQQLLEDYDQSAPEQ